MDARSPIEGYNPTVALSIAFNAESSHFSVGLNSGYRIINVKTCRTESSKDLQKGVGFVQMLNRTNLLGMIGGGRRRLFNPHKVVIWDDGKSQPVREITCLSPVRSVRLVRNEIVAALANEVRVYNYRKPTPELLARYPTADNPVGLCCVSSRMMAFPGRTVGQVQLVESESGNVSIIPAHSSPLRALAFSPDGELLATASEKGTLVRVWSTKTNAKIVELRRGADPAMIFSLSFNPSSTLLASTSDKGTLHIYDIPHTAPPATVSSQRAALNSNGSDAGSLCDDRPDLSKVDSKGKWGLIGKLPLVPQYFRDITSFTSAEFFTGDDPGMAVAVALEAESMGLARLPKGITVWPDEDTVMVIGAGADARWEKFIITIGQDGLRACVRSGWKRYLEDS